MTKGAPIWYRKTTRRGGFDVPGTYLQPSLHGWIVRLQPKGGKPLIVSVNPARVRERREDVRA